MREMRWKFNNFLLSFSTCFHYSIFFRLLSLQYSPLAMMWESLATLPSTTRVFDEKQREERRDDGNGINFIAEEIGQLSLSSICWLEGTLHSTAWWRPEAHESELDFIIWLSVTLSGLVWMMSVIEIERKWRCKKIEFAEGNEKHMNLEWTRWASSERHKLRLIQFFVEMCEDKWNLCLMCFIAALQNRLFLLSLLLKSLSVTFLRKFCDANSSNRLNLTYLA